MIGRCLVIFLIIYSLHNTSILSMPDSKCSICLESLPDCDKYVSGCQYHTFHTACITTWLVLGENCPVCRKPVLVSEKQKIEICKRKKEIRTLLFIYRAGVVVTLGGALLALIKQESSP